MFVIEPFPSEAIGPVTSTRGYKSANLEPVALPPKRDSRSKHHRFDTDSPPVTIESLALIIPAFHCHYFQDGSL